MLSMNARKFGLQIYAHVLEGLLDVQRPMCCVEWWVGEGLTDVRFRSAGDKKEDGKTFS
jgi:hypothetical protein